MQEAGHQGAGLLATSILNFISILAILSPGAWLLASTY